MLTAEETVAHHNAVVERAMLRAEQLEGRLASLLEPLLHGAGNKAAAKFEEKATDYLTAAVVDEFRSALFAKALRERDKAHLAAEGAGARALVASLALSGSAAGVTSLSTMIAVKPRGSEAGRIASSADGSLDAEELHVTLAYLGEYEGDLASLAAVLGPVAARHAPLEGQVAGVGSFQGNGEVAPVILMPSVPGLVELRVAVTEALTHAGVSFSRDYGYVPHMTVAYQADPDHDRTPLGEELHFDELLIVRGDVEVVPLPMVGAKPLTASALSGTAKEIAAVAERHQPDGGYGDTWWNEDDGVVFWTCGDWTTNEEVDEAVEEFLAVEGVKTVQDCAECGAPGERGWEKVYPSSLTAAGDPTWAPPAPDEIVDVEALVSQLRTKTDPVRLAMIKTTMRSTLEKHGISFDVTNDATHKVLAHSAEQITAIAQTTQLNVNRIVSAAYREGLSIPDTAKAIRVGMAEAAGTRATLIARTEMVGAVNGGSLAATMIVEEETGLALAKEWLTAPGAKYPRHEDYEGLDGQTAALNGVFTVGGDELQFPGDPKGSPEEICNCRCTIGYKTGDEAAGLLDVATEDASLESLVRADAVEPLVSLLEGDQHALQSEGQAMVEEVGNVAADNPLYAKRFVGEVLYGYDGRGVLGVVRGSTGEVTGAIHLRKMSDGNVLVEGVGSTADGVGTALMREAAREASRDGVGVALQPTPEALGFYEKLGMSYDKAKNLYSWTPQQARDFAATGLHSSSKPLSFADNGRTLSADQVDEWVTNGESRYSSSSLFHATDDKGTLETEGFKADMLGKSAGGTWGNGVYLSNIQEARYGTDSVRVAVRLKNPIVGTRDEVSDKLSEVVPGLYESKEEVRLAALRAGYDGLVMDMPGGTKWVVAYDPSAVRVVASTKLPPLVDKTIEKATITPLVARPYQHWADSTVARQIVKSRSIVRKALEKDPTLASLTPREMKLYETHKAKLQVLLDERAARKGQTLTARVETTTVSAPVGNMSVLQSAYANRTVDLARDGVANLKTKEWESMVRERGATFADEIDARIAKSNPDVIEHMRRGWTNAESVTLRRNAIKEVLSEVRPVGVNFYDVADTTAHDTMLKAESRSDPSVVSLVHDASSWYPKEWIERASTYELPVLRDVEGNVVETPRAVRTIRYKKAERGYFIEERLGQNYHQIGISDEGRSHVYEDPRGYSVAIHELGHLMEAAVPGIRRAESEFYYRRTHGEKVTNYKGQISEVVRRDEFVDEYMGKDYSPGAADLVGQKISMADEYMPGVADSYELLSMGMEDLITGSHGMWERDPDMRNFILGLLVSV